MLKICSGRAGLVRALLLTGSASAALALPGAAFAQDGADAAEATDAADADAGNSILVTATKRERTLQDTPVAVLNHT